MLEFPKKQRGVMRALVIYGSMYGNTHHIAEAIADGLNLLDDVQVVPVTAAPQSSCIK
jgi:flavodoxin